MIAQMLPGRQLPEAHWTGLPPRRLRLRAAGWGEACPGTRRSRGRGPQPRDGAAERLHAPAQEARSVAIPAMDLRSSSIRQLYPSAQWDRLAFCLWGLCRANWDAPRFVSARPCSESLPRAGTNKPRVLPRWHRPTDRPRWNTRRCGGRARPCQQPRDASGTR